MCHRVDAKNIKAQKGSLDSPVTQLLVKHTLGSHDYQVMHIKDGHLDVFPNLKLLLLDLNGQSFKEQANC